MPLRKISLFFRQFSQGMEMRQFWSRIGCNLPGKWPVDKHIVEDKVFYPGFHNRNWNSKGELHTELQLHGK